MTKRKIVIPEEEREKVKIRSKWYQDEHRRDREKMAAPQNTDEERTERYQKWIRKGKVGDI